MRRLLAVVVVLAMVGGFGGGLAAAEGAEWLDERPQWATGSGEATESATAATPSAGPPSLPQAARQQLATFGGIPGAGVDGFIFLEDVDLEGARAVLVARFVPPTGGYHLYSKDMPKTGIDGIGRPTLLEIPPDQPIEAVGALQADQPVSDKTVMDWVFPLYPAGPVELRLAVRLPQGDGQSLPVTLWMTYMTCDDESCLRPVEREAVAVSLPTVANGVDRGESVQLSDEAATVVATTDRPSDDSDDSPLQTGVWYYPQNVEQLRDLLARAEAAELPALLDFTGPSCLNCQIMKRTVFVLPEVVDSFSNLVLLSINTDPPHADLGDFQVEHFGTFTRPFYVRTHPGDVGQAWATFFRPANQAALERFTTFLDGGAGDAPATLEAVADSVSSAGGWGGFLLLAVLGGLFTLVMPCTYPMIPLTINFFTKQGAGARRVWPLAAVYASGIIAFFVGVGLVFALLIRGNPAYLAGHWLTNLIIGGVFLILGASLLGMFFLRLPTSLANLGGGRNGYGGALLMGLAFAVISFTCTAPFAGLVLGSAMLAGTWTAAVIGMAVYAAVIAIPFFFLALSPGLLKRLPGAGAWMNEFKVVGGLIEIAAAFKFLYMTDHYFSWGIIDRTSTLALWTTISLVIAIYLSGALRMEGDAPVKAIGGWRLMLMTLFAAVGLVFLAGLTGVNLGAIEGLFP